MRQNPTGLCHNNLSVSTSRPLLTSNQWQVRLSKAKSLQGYTSTGSESNNLTLRENTTGNGLNNSKRQTQTPAHLDPCSGNPHASDYTIIECTEGYLRDTRKTAAPSCVRCTLSNSRQGSRRDTARAWDRLMTRSSSVLAVTLAWAGRSVSPWRQCSSEILSQDLSASIDFKSTKTAASPA